MKPKQGGVSLIEALVALAVMAFGMLGMVGMQATMRQNSDVAKQRSEAVRIAQEAIETRRAFTVLNTTVGKLAYADLVDVAPSEVSGITSNATFTRTVTISDLGSGRTKTIVVDVGWADRTGALQSVRLSTTATGTLPELAATVGLPTFGAPKRMPTGRHFAIPTGAVDQHDGTSLFTPPGGGGVNWQFSNTTGYITGTNCVAGVCASTDPARLLSGFVNFATALSGPSPQLAEDPTCEFIHSPPCIPSLAIDLDVVVYATFPTMATATVSCFKSMAPRYLAYFCAVPAPDLGGNKWSGPSELVQAGTLQHFADGTFKVCRYTPVQGDPLVGDVVNGKPFRNEEHPLYYLNATASLINQNFLVIRAAFDCPDDDSATPLVNGNTWNHQPIH